MTRNYLKVSLRNLARDRTYAIINILGLTIGITSVLLISLYIQRELSYDNFFAYSNRTYRVALQRIYPNHERYFASSALAELHYLLAYRYRTIFSIVGLKVLPIMLM